MNDAYRCPKCKLFIIGTYCFNCKEDIHEIRFNSPLDDVFKDVFKEDYDE